MLPWQLLQLKSTFISYFDITVTIYPVSLCSLSLYSFTIRILAEMTILMALLCLTLGWLLLAAEGSLGPLFMCTLCSHFVLLTLSCTQNVSSLEKLYTSRKTVHKQKETGLFGGVGFCSRGGGSVERGLAVMLFTLGGLDRAASCLCGTLASTKTSHLRQSADVNDKPSQHHLGWYWTNGLGKIALLSWHTKLTIQCCPPLCLWSYFWPGCRENCCGVLWPPGNLWLIFACLALFRQFSVLLDWKLPVLQLPCCNHRFLACSLAHYICLKGKSSLLFTFTMQ